MSELELEQRTNIKFLVKLGNSGNKIREMLAQVCGDNAWRKQQFPSGWNVILREEKVSLTKRDRTASNKQNWRKHCKNLSNCAWKSLADCQEHSRASEHRQRNSWENLNWRSWHEEGLCKNCPKESHRRTKRQRRVTICQDILERQDDILGRVITGDETWVYQYDPETKRQSAQWKTANSPRPNKFHQSKSRVRTMLPTFFVLEGLFIVNLYQLDKQSTKFTFVSIGKAVWKS